MWVYGYLSNLGEVEDLLWDLSLYYCEVLLSGRLFLCFNTLLLCRIVHQLMHKRVFRPESLVCESNSRDCGRESGRWFGRGRDLWNAEGEGDSEDGASADEGHSCYEPR